MVHKVFEIIGERALLYRELYNDESEILKKGLRKEFIEQILANKAEKIVGIFQRSDSVRRTRARGKGEIDFIDPIYEEGIISSSMQIDKTKGRCPKGRINPKNPLLRIFYGIEINALEYIGYQEGLPSFRGKLFFQNIFDDDIFNEGHYNLFNRYVKPIHEAGFEVYEIKSEIKK